MTDRNPERNELQFRGSEGLPGSENDALDRELDAALAKYAAVEPRAGLEERILANLQSEQTRTPERAWRRWCVAAAAAAVIVVAVALAWKSGRPVQQQIVQHTPAQQSPQQPPPQVEANDQHIGAGSATTPKRQATVRHSQPVIAVVATANPKLDVFPSPQPLSEQERLLLDYVHQSPMEAAQIARAQTELAAREEAERVGLQAGAGQSGNTKNVLE
jgi:hypothetical protein